MKVAQLRATTPCGRASHGVAHRRPLNIIPFVLAVCLVGAARAEPLSLGSALNLAEQRNASLRSLQATRSTLEGESNEANALLWNNPQVATEHRWRQLSQAEGGPVKKQDTGIGLAQTFELGGQQSARRAAAKANQDSLVDGLEDARRTLRADVEQRFVQVLSLQQRLGIERESLQLLQQAASAVGRRVKAGEDSRLDGNLSAVEAERGANQASQTEEQLTQARAALATALQWDRPTPPEPVDELDAVPAKYTLNDLLEVARRNPRLRTLESKQRAAQARLDLENAARYPDLTVGLNYSPEKNIDGRDRITTLVLTLPLPLFRRNDAGIGRASTELTQVSIERAAASREAEISIPALWERVQSLQQRVSRLTATVLPALEQNQTLSLRALREGEIGLTQFLLARRQALDGKRDLLDARTDLRLARSALEAAAGWPEQLPQPLPAPTATR